MVINLSPISDLQVFLRTSIFQVGHFKTGSRQCFSLQKCYAVSHKTIVWCWISGVNNFNVMYMHCLIVKGLIINLPPTTDRDRDGLFLTSPSVYPSRISDFLNLHVFYCNVLMHPYRLWEIYTAPMSITTSNTRYNFVKILHTFHF